MSDYMALVCKYHYTNHLNHLETINYNYMLAIEVCNNLCCIAYLTDTG